MGNISWKYDKSGMPTDMTVDLQGPKEITAKVSGISRADADKISKKPPSAKTAEVYAGDGTLDRMDTSLVTGTINYYLTQQLGIRGQISDVRLQSDTPHALASNARQTFNRASGIEVENNSLNFGGKLHVSLSGLTPEDVGKLESYINHNPEFVKGLVDTVQYNVKDGLNAAEKQGVTSQTNFMLKDAGVSASVKGMAAL